MSFETPQSLLFRDAVPDDVAALTALARKTFTDKFGHLYNPDDLAAFLEESHNPDLYRDWIADPDVLVRVCEADGGDIVAYLLCSPLSLPAPDPEPGALELKRVYVDGRLQGRGTGSRFIDEALAWMPSVFTTGWAGKKWRNSCFRSAGTVILNTYCG